jgi:thiol:disulfide interchange protein/DsbC/DsbD-like thiol-disulfide interchange protein
MRCRSRKRQVDGVTAVEAGGAKFLQQSSRCCILASMPFMRGFIVLLLVAGSAWAQFEFPGAGSPFGRKRPVRARLVLSHEVARPGDTVVAALELTMDAGWHTYWRNGGDSGEATKLLWAPLEGIAVGPTEWPVPEKFTATAGDATLVTYVYHNRATLLLPLTVATNASAGPRNLSALAWWLQCTDKQCVPGSNMVQATLVIGNESKPSADTTLFTEARRRLPSRDLPGSAKAAWDQGGNVTNRAFLIEWSASAIEPDFFPYTNSLAAISNITGVVLNSGSNVVLRKTAKRTGGAWPTEIAGLLVRKESDALVGYETTLTLAESAVSSETNTGASSPTRDAKSLWVWLLYAFVGGLILNIMPCVLPVIALKILGFVSQSREAPRRVRILGLLYTLGVVASFLVLAGVVIGVKAAGQKAGWGMQFSNPQFIVILIVVVTLVALNLFGVFEVTVGGRALNAANDAASRHGSLGAFMNGVLATVLATPCTAPFLGAALGFAFVQPAPVIVLFFVTIGLGLALPYLILSGNPRLLKFLPKPGPWMVRFKVAMGFPMLATAIWLFTLTINFYHSRVIWLGVFLVLIAAAAWIFGEFVQKGSRHRTAAAVVALLLLAGGTDTIQESPDGIVWRRWSPAAVESARAEGRPVFVDFTAAWCLTCQLNKNTSIEIPAVREKLKQVNAVALLADYTRYPPDISAELEKFGRAGVPLVVVYPRDPAKVPIVLPEILTPALVLKALDAASQ